MLTENSKCEEEVSLFLEVFLGLENLSLCRSFGKGGEHCCHEEGR